MQIYFADESGISNESQFFILGALGAEEAALDSLEKGVSRIKEKNHIPPNVEIKWNLNDLNRQLTDNSLQPLDQGTHTKVKSQIVELIVSNNPQELFVLWFLSPLEFFNSDPWRSYNYAMNILFSKINDQLGKRHARGIILLDEITRLKRNKSEVRTLVEQFIHTYKSSGKSSNISLIIPEVNTKICFGHQLNDMLIGLLNNYLLHLHDGTSGPSSGVIGALKKVSKFIPVNFVAQGKLPVYGAGVHIYPKTIVKPSLKAMMKKTYTSLGRDFNFS